MTHNSRSTRETRLRRKADRCGYALKKSPRRDPKAVDFGLYALIDIETGGAVNAAIANHFVHSWSLEEVETFLS